MEVMKVMEVVVLARWEGRWEQPEDLATGGKPRINTTPNGNDKQKRTNSTVSSDSRLNDCTLTTIKQIPRVPRGRR